MNLEVTANPAAKQLRFAITDTGIGISAEDLPKLFKPFVQLDSKLARQYEGTGLGLVLVKKMVEMQGGTVDVQSEPGMGSTFSFVLPWEPLQEIPAPTPELESQMVRTTLKTHAKLLIADDDEVTVMLINDYLEEFGYQISVADDGREVLPKVEEAQPDLILMDIQMPYANGLDLTRRLKADPRYARIPIIGLTAFAMASDKERCLEAGMNDYLSKPINLKELRSLIESLLN